MKKLRLWLASKLIGNTQYMKNVVFYQTVCLDMNANTVVEKVNIKLGHDLEWVGKEKGIGLYFNDYEESVIKVRGDV
jgi:hypothetical protein